MNPASMQLADNQVLDAYLSELEALLLEREVGSVVESVALARRHSAGLSTEFFRELRVAIKRMLDVDQAILSDTNRAARQHTAKMGHANGLIL